MKIIIGLIKEYFESRRIKKKIKKIYGRKVPVHQGLEDIKNRVDVIRRTKCQFDSQQ